jgi:hypothetical protein
MTQRSPRSRPTHGALRFGCIAGLVAVLSLFAPLVIAQSPNGFWQLDGYGLLVEIESAKLSTFQLTSVSCIPWWTAGRSNDGSDTNEVVFNRGDAEIRLIAGSSPDVLLMREGPSISRVSLRRITDRPNRCNETLANTPANNYAVFWHTYAEQFALFELYRTDWNAVDRKFRPQVTASTTPEELFGLLREMILPFHNAHTNINAASIRRSYLGYRPSSDIGRKLNGSSTLSIGEILGLFSDQALRTRAIVESKYAKGPLRPYVNDRIYFGMLDGAIGYMRILTFSEYTKDGSFAQEAAALDAALDDIFKDAERMRGLVIDVRVNTGGSDQLCLAIASRLSGAKYLAYSTVTRTNPRGPTRFTEPQQIWVEPAARPGYRGNVALLIGPDAISGGETFAMALIGRRPAVTFVGENTQGVFSDVWGRKLPNGWTFGLPTEVYLTMKGKSFDRVGVMPAIRVPVFPKSDLDNGRDGALARAIEVLEGREHGSKLPQ